MLKHINSKITNTLNNNIIYVFVSSILMFIYFSPRLVEDTQAFRYIRLLQTGFFVVSIVLILIRKKINLFSVLTIVFFTILLCSTILFGKNLELYIAYLTSTFAPLILFEYLYNIDKRKFLKVISSYSFTMLFLNTILLLLYKNGLLTIEKSDIISKGIHFFGESNQSTIIIILFYTIVILREFLLEEKNITILFLSTLFSALSIFMIDSSNGKVGYLLLVFGIFLIYLLDFFIIDLFKNYKKIAIIGVILFVTINLLIVVFRVQNLFDIFFKILFNKDSSLSTRTIIWDSGLKLAKSSPILGYGIKFGRFIYVSSTGNYFDSHNLFLETILRGGILLLTSFISIIYLSLRNISKQFDIKTKAFGLIMITIFLIMSIGEVYKLNVIFFILYLPYLISGYKDKKVGIYDK